MSVVTLASCPNCAGMGELPGNGDWADGHAPMVACRKCGGAGDADAARLVAAYECALRDRTETVVARLKELAKMVEMAIEDAQRPIKMTGAQLRQRVGG